MRQEKLFFVVFGFQAPEVGPTQKKYSERVHPPPPRRNTIGIFQKIVLKNLRVIPRIPSPFKLGHISHSAVLLYIQNRHCVSDAPTIKWDLSLLKSVHFQTIRESLTIYEQNEIFFERCCAVLINFHVCR